MLASITVSLTISGTILLFSCSATEYRHRAKFQDFPYVVRLLIDKSDGKMICTGSLIHPQWVLTAAHCTTGYTFIRVHATAGEGEEGNASLIKDVGDKTPLLVYSWPGIDVNRKSIFTTFELKEHSVEKSITYPGFVNKLALIGMNLNNDYSLVRLESGFDVENKNVELILLENKTWTEKQRNCLAVGFGSRHREEGLYVFSVNAFHGTCPCKTKKYLLERYICSTVDEKYGSSICPGDSGGPLICNDKQVGIASHNYPSNGCDLFSTRTSKDFGCDVQGTVSSFTYICPVLSWIREYVGDSVPIQPHHC